ncbi:MAG TPA: sigma-54 dependent transcriptional regulator [Ohtaekwangia sp.]|nr:sigma-54 dependent transcriptional regulator [Ohtaekwangia sp.]
MQKLNARILVIDDDKDVLTAARIVLRQKFEIVDTENNPEKLRSLLQVNRYDVILLDMNYSSGRTSGTEGLYWLKQILSHNADQRIIMITAYGDIKLAVDAMKEGAADFIVKPWDNDKLEATVYASYQYTLTRKELNQLKSKQSHYSRIVNAPESELIGQSSLMRQLMNAVQKVASTDANILLLGENGTGKELIAKFIHFHSSRRDQPFIKVDLGSLSENLFESEMFGHKKGAFTDAKAERIGRIELAHGGTLMLDEVGNLSLGYQVKLLSVLQNREVIPLGKNTPVQVDIRLICATNLDIHEAVRAGNFREDFLYRINTVEITVPPLRDRSEDIPLLANYFLKMYASRYRKENVTITEDGLNHLQNHSWPGNVRELQHAVERAVILSDHPRLTKRDFLFSLKKPPSNREETLNLDEIERKTILNAIEIFNGNMSKVAKELGVGRTTLYRKLEKYGLDKKDQQ